MAKRTIIYINFAQYDNTGRILDYLLDNFDVVIQFSYDHLRLKNGRKSNFLRVYEKKKLVENTRLQSIRTPSLFLFISLPFVAIFMVLQTLFNVIRLKYRYGTFDIFFTVNAFSGAIGILIKSVGLCKKTVFWVWDFFPIKYPDWRIKMARWVYWQFDRICMKFSDRIVFTNERLVKLRKETNHLPKNYKAIIVPIGTMIKDFPKRKKYTPILGYLGMMKDHQGLDLWLENLEKVFSVDPALTIEIIGSGPFEEIYRKKARKFTKRVHFYGFIEDQDKIQSIVRKWSIGLATYLPIESNESYWGDPSKIKAYISLGIPVITTNVSYFSKEIKKTQAGIVIGYNIKDLQIAIKKILKNEKIFSAHALKLAEKYDYKKIYSKLFTF